MDNLIKQLNNYTEKDLSISGIPEITYNVLVCNNLKHRRHTNFSYGILSPIPSIITDNSITWNSLNKSGDLISGITFYVRDLDDLKNIILSIDDFDPIILSLEYLKIYNIVCRQIIFQSDLGFLITFNPVNLFIFYDKKKENDNLIKLDSSSIKYFSGLPTILSDEIKINWICVSGKNIQHIILKLNSIILDNEEKRKFLTIDARKKIFDIESYQILKNNTDCWDLSQCRFLPYGFIGCEMSILDYNLLDSIEITFDDLKIKITKLVIEIYDKFYSQIIFDNNDNIIIKIKFLSIFDKYKKCHIDIDYYLCINYINGHKPVYNKIYQFQNTNDISDKNCLIVYNDFESVYSKIFTNGYYEYICDLHKLYPESDIDSVHISIPNEKIGLTHIKEIFIFFTNTKTNKREKIAKKFKITIANITNEYNSIDMDIYSNTHHDNTDKFIYNIGYSLNHRSYPNGQFNIAGLPIKIISEFREKINLLDYNITIVFFGYNVIQ